MLHDRRQGDDGPQRAAGRCCDTPQMGYDETKALIADWHGKGRSSTPSPRASPSPRRPSRWRWRARWRANFPTCISRRICRRTSTRSRFARELFPGRGDYTDIYDRYGLLGPKSLLGHCIHLSDREADVLSRDAARSRSSARPRTSSSAPAFSTMSAAAGAKAVRMAAATDIGGGTSYSMLRTLDEGYK